MAAHRASSSVLHRLHGAVTGTVHPVSVMPEWLRVIATSNPLAYMVDGLRQLMVHGGTASDPLILDIGVLALDLVRARRRSRPVEPSTNRCPGRA
jgi:ABC-type polysaccharide/polyol phosphate export permease